jgi:hypothetical protein
MIFTAVGWDWLFTVYAAAFLIAGTMWFIIDPRRTFYDEGTTVAEQPPAPEAAEALA